MFDISGSAFWSCSTLKPTQKSGFKIFWGPARLKKVDEREKWKSASPWWPASCWRWHNIHPPNQNICQHANILIVSRLLHLVALYWIVSYLGFCQYGSRFFLFWLRKSCSLPYSPGCPITIPDLPYSPGCLAATLKWSSNPEHQHIIHYHHLWGEKCLSGEKLTKHLTREELQNPWKRGKRPKRESEDPEKGDDAECMSSQNQEQAQPYKIRQESKGYWVVTNSFSPNPALQILCFHVHKQLQSNGKEKMGCRLRGETGCSWRGKKWKHNLCISDFSGATYPNFYKRGTYKYSWADQGAAFSGY